MDQGSQKKGTSASALWRHRLMEEDPDRYRLMQEKQRERERRRREKYKSLWASGTRAAMEHREVFLAKKREVNRRTRLRQAMETKTCTRSAALAGSAMTTPRVNRKSMTPDERREHDNAKRRERYHMRSKQKKAADRKKNLKKMREYRLRKKMACPSLLEATPLAARSPVAGPSATPPRESTPVTPTTPPRRKRMRQHCYNVTNRVKTSLRKFSAEECASVTRNLVLRKTPEKRRRNIEKLIEHPEVKRALLPACKTPQALGTPRATALFLTKTKRLRASRYALVKREIQKFYLRADISRVLPHKRYATKHGPGHVMIVTIDVAHKTFCEETGRRVSRSLFAQLRPRNVRKVGTVATETCLCICCTNIKIKIDALNRGMKSSVIPAETQLMDFILCPYSGRWPRIDCVNGNCVACNDHLRPFTLAARSIFHDQITWLHWERRPRPDDSTAMKLDVFSYSGTVYDLLTQLSKDLKEPVKGTSFMQHLFTAYWQQSQYNLCKDTLQQGQLLMVQDFAKNRTASYSEEVKSAFFGKQQISLHPSVCYYKNGDGQMMRHVIMFFSDDIKHDTHHVHAVTEKAVDIVSEVCQIKEVIIWSDGAASQYKGRRTFADLTLYSLPMERHFFGSEHGKGEADGETGRFSQAMARSCASGNNFRNARDMVDFATSVYKDDPFKKYTFVEIPLEDIRRDRPETDVSTIPGTRSFHEVKKKKRYCVAARTYSCFCSGCRADEASCCINKLYVKPFEYFKMCPSVPQDEALLEDEKEPDNTPVQPEYTSTDSPSVGQWVEIRGNVHINKRKGQEERTYKAMVIHTPEGGFQDYFYVQFLKKTPAGSYVISSGDISHIHPGTEERYRWRVIPAPTINNRNHHFF